jgi:hypothetical protein
MARAADASAFDSAFGQLESPSRHLDGDSAVNEELAAVSEEAAAAIRLPGALLQRYTFKELN